MKTFADIKRRLTVGTELDMIYHRYPVKDLVLPMRRVVVKAQSNAVAFSAWPGKDRPAWLWWGKASEYRIDDQDTFSVLDPDSGVVEMTYRFR